MVYIGFVGFIRFIGVYRVYRVCGSVWGLGLGLQLLEGGSGAS